MTENRGGGFVNSSSPILVGSPGWDLKVEKVILRVLSNTASSEDKQIVSDAAFALRCVVRRPRYWAPLFALARSRIGR